MPYPDAHLYLTLHWVPGEMTDETGQVGFRFNATGAATQARVDAAAAAVSTFWSTASSRIGSDYSLKYIRLAQIGTDGHYPAGTQAYDHVYGTGIPGGAAQVPMPLQVASVASLVTTVSRGQAHAGRVYLPPIAVALDGTVARWTTSSTFDRATALATMLSSLAGVFNAGSRAMVYSKGTKSSIAGAANPVTGVKVGGRPDVQRRRAKKQLEVYSATIAVTAP